MKIKDIAVVTAMEQEARALFPSAISGTLGPFELLIGSLKDDIGFRCIISGPGKERAAQAAAILCREKPDILLNIGVSGGLVAGIGAGEIVAATAIVSDDSRYENWRENEKDALARSRLFPSCGDIQCGWLTTVNTPVLVPEDKQQLHEQTGALAVDMESIAVVAEASKNSIPFACIRVISDDSRRSIPREALTGVTENGKTTLSPILKAILKRPSLIFELIPMGRDYSRALKTLGTFFPEKS